MNISDLISQADAARLRGVSRAAISELVSRGRFKIYSIGGKRLLSRTEVLNFEPDPGGRPPNRNGKGKTKK
jgi:excisionase family DNA binding protein